MPGLWKNLLPLCHRTCGVLYRVVECRDRQPLRLFLSQRIGKSRCFTSLETRVLEVLWQGPWKGTAGREIKEIHTECTYVWRVWCIWQGQTWDGDAPPPPPQRCERHLAFHVLPASPALSACKCRAGGVVCTRGDSH